EPPPNATPADPLADGALQDPFDPFRPDGGLRRRGRLRGRRRTPRPGRDTELPGWAPGDWKAGDGGLTGDGKGTLHRRSSNRPATRAKARLRGASWSTQ
ncbi:hypothetical protein K4A07_18755, partial [Lactiplantibacillus plantarum]|nr:hypothetical protein [Lactiplantibacillus plantarum]